MSQHPVPDTRPHLSNALVKMVEALAILDELKAPGDIGSLLDLAIVRLEDQLGVEHQHLKPVETLLAQLMAEPPEAEPATSASPWDAAPV